ncbi:hypothetical protein [Nocardioides ochotonae]|uniref:hypothetical protein n=1 Tax=Nocardioides ochotonae TaxID=2685869 RepID=UPI001409101A|nr:hypothetical protein [Nocardioides ochotonae]
MSDDEAKAVADGKISFEEYDAAVTRFRECMAANGTPIENFRFDEPTRQYEWTVWESYFDNPGAQACERELQMTDMLWQNQVETELEAEQAPLREERRVKIIECMRTKGADVESDLPYGELMVRASQEFPECVDEQFPT